MNSKYEGSKEYFDIDWKNRKEKTHNYFTEGDPQTQMQLAFKNHYDLYERVFFKGKRGKCLEVGCGRGNLSLYFAYNKWEASLLDQSASAIEVAKENFNSLNLKGNFIVGDANALPFDDNTFTTTFSVGLLEHFQDVEPTIKEQFRVLEKGGIFIGYVVPERKLNIQTLAKPVNKALSLAKKFIDPGVDSFKKEKDLLFRSDFGSRHYLDIMKKYPFKATGSFGTFCVPSISYSEIYPFTPLPKKLEKTVVTIQKSMLHLRSRFMEHPWQCSEFLGQAFVVWGIK